MYRVRYLEQTDKMSQQVRLSMFEEVYPHELLWACAQQSVTNAPKARAALQRPERVVVCAGDGPLEPPSASAGVG